jgi:hypothetical protein
MTSERLGEMFKCDSADMCNGKFPLVLMIWGDERTRQACADGEQGPPSVLAELNNASCKAH